VTSKLNFISINLVQIFAFFVSFVFVLFCVSFITVNLKNMDEVLEKLLEFIKALLDVLFVCACVMCFLRHVVALSLIFSLISASPHDIRHSVIIDDGKANSELFLSDHISFRISQFDQFFVTVSNSRIRWNKITWTTFVTFS